MREGDRSSRYYIRENKITAAEIDLLRKTGRNNEADYFISLDKVENETEKSAPGFVNAGSVIPKDDSPMNENVKEPDKMSPPSAEMQSDEIDEINNRGLLALQGNDIKHAIKYFQQVIDHDPLNRQAIIGICTIFKKMNHLRRALPLLRAVSGKVRDEEISALLAEAEQSKENSIPACKH